MKSKEFLG